MSAAGTVSKGVRREASLLSRRQPVTGGEATGLEEVPARASRTAGTAPGFDAQERVTPRAFDLHARVTAESAVDGHPGFVPAGFLAGQGPGTAVAELCAAEVWEPVVGGYRILDRRAVQRCLDLA